MRRMAVAGFALCAMLVFCGLPASALATPNTDAASAVSGFAATLNGDLNPEGVESSYYFSWGAGSSCAGNATALTSAGAGNSDVHEEATIEDLEPNTQYAFCLNEVVEGVETAGASSTFTTVALAPAVDDQPTAVSTISGTEATLRGAVNAENENTTYYFSYGPTAAYGSTSSPLPGAALASEFGDEQIKARLTGLRADTTYHYQLVAVNAAGESRSPDETFTTLQAAPPSVTDVGVSEVTSFGATLSGSVNSGSSGSAIDDTRWCFEYGTGTTYNLGYLPGPAGDAGQGAEDVPLSVQLTDLQPGTTYHYRLVAVNAIGVVQQPAGCDLGSGQQTASVDATFTTPVELPSPLAVTGIASGVSQNAATLAGTVDPDGYRTSYEFQVGIDTSYGAQIFGEAGSGDEAQPVGLVLQGLQPGTTYHYRLVAIGQGGTSYGADATFTTPVFATATISAPAPAPLIATPTVTIPSISVATTTIKHKTAKTKPKKKTTKSRRRRKGGKARKAGRDRVSQREGRSGR